MGDGVSLRVYMGVGVGGGVTGCGGEYVWGRGCL